MSHNSNPNADTSGFNYPSAAGLPTNVDETRIGPSVDLLHGKLGGEHGGSGTRADDRKGENVPTTGETASPVAEHIKS
jgi:hypothetical protein